MAGIDNVYFNIKSERHSFYQALLSLGDRRVAPAIEAAERNGGNWRAAVAEAGVDADFYVFRDRSRRRRAAVGHHRRRHEADFFRAEVDKALREEWTLPPKRAQRERAPAAGAVSARVRALLSVHVGALAARRRQWTRAGILALSILLCDHAEPPRLDRLRAPTPPATSRRQISGDTDR